MKKWIKDNIWYVLIIFLFSILLMYPKMTNGVFEAGHDDYFHISIIQGYLESFKNGDFFPNILPEIGFNFGYGSPMLYPTTMHWLISLVASVLPISNNIEVGVDISYLMNFFLSGLGIYLLSNYLFKNKIVGLISAILYASYPYHLSTLFIRFSISESWIFVFLPILVLGVFKYLKEECRGINVWFVIGLVGCMYSHILTTAFISALLLFLLPFYLYRKENRDIIKGNIKSFIISSIIVLLIGFPLLINLLYFKQTHNLYVFTEGAMSNPDLFKSHALVLKEMLWNPGTIRNEFIYKNNNINFGMSLSCMILLISSIITIIFNKKIKVKEAIASLLLVLIVTTMFLMLLPPFGSDVIVNRIVLLQFPWRLMNLFSLLVCLIAPTIFLLKVKGSKIVSILVMIFIFMSSFNDYYFGCNPFESCKITQQSQYIRPTSVETYEELYKKPDVNVGHMRLGTGNEYVDNTFFYYNIGYVLPVVNNVVVESGDLANPQIISNNVPTLIFRIEGNGEGMVKLPRFYYNDYELKDEEGNKYELFNNQGMIDAKVQGNKTYTLKYNEPTAITIGKVVRLSGVILLIILVLYPKYKNHKK